MIVNCKIKCLETLTFSQMVCGIKFLDHENCVVEKMLGINLRDAEDVELLDEVLLCGYVQHVQVHAMVALLAISFVSSLHHVLRDPRCCLRMLKLTLQFNTSEAPSLPLLVDALMHETCQIADLNLTCHAELTIEDGKQLGRLLTSARALPLKSLVFGGNMQVLCGLCSCFTAACVRSRVLGAAKM
jgi:hypothetical protein